MIQQATDVLTTNQLKELLNKVQKQGEQIIITHAGKPIAALIDYTLFEKIGRNETRFQQLSDELEQAFTNEQNIEILVNEAICAGRING